MKKFNEKLHKDITLLKSLHTRRDKTEYMKMRNLVMKRHNICESTVYRQMKKAAPGLDHTKSHHAMPRPVTDEEVNMVRELLLKQHSLMEIRTAMERHTGDTCSYNRIDKIRQEIDKRSWPPAEEPEPTAFGENIRKLFNEYCKLDLMDPNRTLTLKLKGKEYTVNCSVIKQAINKIIYSAENEGRSTRVIHRMKMEELLTRKMQLIESGHYVTTAELKSLEHIRRSLLAS